MKYLKKLPCYFQSAVKRYIILPKLKILGKIFLIRGDFFRAERELKEALARTKSSKRVHILRLLALTYFRSGRHTEALELFNNLPKDPEILYHIGKIYAQKNCWNEALGNFRRCRKSMLGKRHNLWEDLAQEEIGRVTKGESIEFGKLDPEIQQVIKTAPTGKEYTEAGAIILLRKSSIKVENDSITTVKRKIIKIFDDIGIRKFGEIKIGYNDACEYIDIEHVRIVKSKGLTITVPENHIKCITPYAKSPFYSDYKIKVVSLPEVEVGSIIDIKFRKKEINLLNGNDFYKVFKIADSIPIFRQKYEVSLPEERNIHVKLPEAKISATKKFKNGRKIYSWEVKNMKAMLTEGKMPSDSEVIPQMLLSSFKNWKEVYGWWKSLYQDKINVDEKMREKIKELTRDFPDEEKIRRIYEWVSNNIRYVGLEFGRGGIEPREATEVFKNRYGDCKDKSILLVSMLREVGVKAYPVLIDIGGKIGEFSIPVPQFNHAIVAVKKRNSLFAFMDPTPSACPYNYLPAKNQGKKCMVFLEDNFRLIETPIFGPEINKEIRRMYIRVTHEGSITVRVVNNSWGEEAMITRNRVKNSIPKEREEILEKEITSFCPSGELLSYSFENIDNFSKPFVVKESFKIPCFLKEIGDKQLSFNLPIGRWGLEGVEKKRKAIPD